MRFLLAHLHINILMDQPTKGDIKQALLHLNSGPDGLDKTYEQAIERINGQSICFQNLAKAILGWIIHAKRPLSISELQHALAVRAYTAALEKDYVPSVDVLQTVCAGLVNINLQTGIICLVHYTTQQYLERTWTSWFPGAQIEITRVCLTYLSFDIFETGPCLSQEGFNTRLKKNVLYDYSAQFWAHHANIASAEEGLTLRFLKSKSKVAAAFQAFLNAGRHSNFIQEGLMEVTGVHIAAYFGLERAMRSLLKDTCEKDIINIDSKDTYFSRTPLSWAAKNGHDAVVELLLDTGEVDTNTQDAEYGRTPLLWAARTGHDAVVLRLLNTGCKSINTEDGYGYTPLLWAAEKNHNNIVKLLLETGRVNINSQDKKGRTPLLVAAQKGYDTIVKLLLDAGSVNVNTQDKTGYAPELWPVEIGHTPTVKILLNAERANINIQDIYGGSPLSWAAGKGHDIVVKQLLDTREVDINTQDRYGQTPLVWAARNGHDAIVKLLLNTSKVDVNTQDKFGQTPLALAIKNGHDSVVKLLLDTGEFNIVTWDVRDWWAPLAGAIRSGHHAVVKLLRETGRVTIDIQDIE